MDLTMGSTDFADAGAILGIMIGDVLCLGSGGGGDGSHILDVPGLWIYVPDVPVLGVDGTFGSEGFDVVGFCCIFLSCSFFPKRKIS